MSSYMTWALVNDKLMNIRQFSSEENKKITKEKRAKCVCCGEPLITNTGYKKDWYYRHFSESKCTGNIEGEVHKYAKDAFTSLNTFNIPKTFALFNSDTFILENEFSIDLKEYEINIEKNITDNIRPDVWLEDFLSRNIICVEFYSTNKKSAKDIKKYNTFIRNILNKDQGEYVYVVEIDLKSISEKINSECTSEEDIKNTLKEYLENNNTAKVITSTQLVKSEIITNTSKLLTTNEDTLCPASNNKFIFNYMQCRKCDFNIKASKNRIICNGKTCLRTQKDLTELLGRHIDLDEKHKDVISMLEDDKSIFYDDLRDRYANLICNLKPKAKTDLIYKSFIGNCKDCGSQLELQVGKYADTYGNIKFNNRANNEYLYRYCPKCNKYEEVKCPYCGSNTKLIKNRWGRIFIKCDNYLSKVDKDYGRSLNNECNFTLTIYKTPECIEYEDEIVAINGLDSLIKYSKSKIMKLLAKCRMDAIRRKR